MFDYLKEDRIEICFYELPFIVDNASSKRQDVVKLAMAAGAVVHMLRSIYGVQCIEVPVANWKGQLHKSNSLRRIKREMKKHYPKYNMPFEAKDHEYDAIGIGLFVQGRF